jgi:hypothetical protein
LDYGRANEKEAGVRVAQRLDELLPQYVPDTPNGLEESHSSLSPKDSRFKIQDSRNAI